MKYIKDELLIWFYFLTPLCIWFVILFFFNTPIGFTPEALSKIPDAITIFIALLFIFKRWLWRLSVLQGWFIRYPDLEGTWQGFLQTTWKNPETGKIPEPIPLILVIKQSFEEISCVMYTEQSTSYSNSALLSEDDSSGIQRLSYNYTNTPDVTIRGRSAIHHGAAILRIVKDGNESSLIGEYWTSRNTAGNISLKLRTKRLLMAFPKNLIAPRKSTKRGKQDGKK